MVRLFVPEGDGQHAITPRRPPPLNAETHLSEIPLQAVIAGAAWTGLLALAGRSRPGIFLKCTAVFSTISLAYEVPRAYGTHHLNKAVFKMEKVEPRPFQLWERSPHWTITDTILAGSVLGLVAATNPRALPGVYGWRRYLGAACVGSTLGLMTGHSVLPAIPTNLQRSLTIRQSKAKQVYYHKLNDDSAAKASLSLSARWSLKAYLWAEFLSPRLRTQSGQTPARGKVGAPNVRVPEVSGTQFTIELESDVLAGPDFEKGIRLYQDDLENRDPRVIKEHLTHMERLKAKTEWEIEFLWQDIATREERLYQVELGDQERLELRQEIHFLNEIFAYLKQSAAIFSYHIVDAHKQLKQIDHPIPSQQDKVSTTSNTRPQSPELITAYMRKQWTLAKDLLLQFNALIAHHQPLQPQSEQSQANAQMGELKATVEELKGLIELVGRVLKDYEEKARMVEAGSSE